MKYFVDANNRVFAYDDEMTEIPEGLTAVSEADALTLVELPQEQLIEVAELEKQGRINDVTRDIDILRDAVELNMATDEEKAALAGLKAYRVLLNRVDVSAAPVINWPQSPQA